MQKFTPICVLSFKNGEKARYLCVSLQKSSAGWAEVPGHVASLKRLDHSDGFVENIFNQFLATAGVLDRVVIAEGMLFQGGEGFFS
jgi:hypothetical protein